MDADEATEISLLREHVIRQRRDPYEVLRNTASDRCADRYADWATEHPAQQIRIANNGWIGIEIMETLNGPSHKKIYPHYLEPVNRPGLDLLEKDEVKTKRPSMWNIVFYNDDYTPMDFVEFVLKTIFHISTLDALALTLAVHTQGKGIAGTYTFEIAEQKQYEVLLLAKTEEHPLRVEVERV
jgi:ATP-dependent Clp protease adaptor protein ClpS